MRAFLAGAWDELTSCVRSSRHRRMLLLFLGACWVSMDVYQHLVVRAVPVLVLDQDNSRLSRTLRLFIQATPEVRVLDRSVESPEEAEALLVTGQAAGVLVIPHAFSADIKHARKARVLLAVDMSNLVLGKTVYKALAKSVGTVAAGAQLTLVEKLGTPKDRALARVLPISVVEGFHGNPATNYAVYLAPTLVFFFLHVLVLILACTALLSGEPLVRRLGRLSSILTVGSLLGLLLAYAFLPRVHLTPQSSWGWLLLCTLLFLAVDLLMAGALVAVLPGRLTGFQVAVLVGMLSLMFSGATWPTEAFPWLLQQLATLVPFTPMARALRMLVLDHVGGWELREAFKQWGVQALVFAAAWLAGLGVRRAVRLAGPQPEGSIP